ILALDILDQPDFQNLAVVQGSDDHQVLEIGLVENVQREDLSPIEEAQAYGRLISEFSFTQEDLAKTVGKSRSHVANTLRLLDLPQPVLAMVENGTLSAGHGRALLSAADPVSLARLVAEKSLSVRETERLAKKSADQAASEAASARAVPEKDADSMALERELAVLLGMKVQLKPKTLQAGTLSIEYSSLEQLDELLRRLSEL
ncbi:MAG: ParB/RepB/Spo0J family partition protein, partial [Pseudomonadota bacterium]